MGNQIIRSEDEELTGRWVYEYMNRCIYRSVDRQIGRRLSRKLKMNRKEMVRPPVFCLALHVHKHHFTRSSQDAHTFCTVSLLQRRKVRLTVTCLSSGQDAHSVSPTPFLSEPDVRKVPRVNTGYEVVALLYLGEDTRCSLCVSRVQCCAMLCFC